MRVRAPGLTVKDVWDALTAGYGVVGSYAKLLEDQLDAPVSGAKADLSTLETRLSAAVAGYLLNLDNADLLNIPDLSTLSAAKIGYLDMAMSALLAAVTLEVLDAFKISVTHMSGVTPGGDWGSNPTFAFDGILNVNCHPVAVNQYAECLFGSFVTLTDFRIHWGANTGTTARWKIEYRDIFGTWNDLRTEIASCLAEAWIAWEDFATQPEADGIRFTSTTYVATGREVTEVQIRGVKGE